jgi:hypothetical protein
MPNRDHEDSQYNRDEGRFDSRDEYGQRDQWQRGSSDWDRGDDWRGTRGQSHPDFQGVQYRGQSDYGRGQQQGDYSRGQSDFSRPQSDYGSSRFGGDQGRYRADQERGFGPRYQASQGGYRDASSWFDQHRDAQHFEVRPQRSQGFGGAGWASSGQDWGRGSAGYRGPDYSRVQSNYGARDLDQTQRYSGVSQGQDYGYRGDARSDESFGQQLRHAGQQVASKVKRVFRGPKGYKRSDERVREDVNDRLAQQDHFDPSDIEVSVQGGEVTLTGTVQSRQEKFLAEEIADDVSGVTEVHNQLRVRREELSQGLGSTSSVTTGTTGQETSARNRNARA